MDHRSILGQLEQLVAETYQLWDEEWVGFTWRNYTLEHVRRVRALAQTLAAKEGADQLVLGYAALLHDITKAYDGEIIMKDGQRQLDENGRWRNQLILPARHNKVTDFYARMDLFGTLHNESGAVVASALMREHGLPADLVERVGAVIASHLRPGENASVEERILYDADTIDANIGLPAFHRNLYINLHREEPQRADFAEWLSERRADFFRWYLGEKVPAWVNARRPEFLRRLTTESGRALAEARYDRLMEFVEVLLAEVPSYQPGDSTSALGVLAALADDRCNPRLSVQIERLLRDCHNGCPRLAREFVEAMHLEMIGQR